MGYTILVAEDDRDIVELIELYLENDGYRVLTAADGVSALELVRREQIDLAVPVSYTHLTLPTIA